LWSNQRATIPFFKKMVHDTSVLIEGSIPNIFFSANMFQIIQFIKDEFMRMSEKIKENLNLLREKTSIY
jgi:hypothetical protein